MNNITQKENCCGCSACFNICPKNAIIMKEDEKGFLFPDINNDICVNCGLCKKVCPIENEINVNEFNQEFYGVKNKDNDIREKSSSGGVYNELIKYVLQRDGICYGAVYNKDFEVKHCRAVDEEECKKQLGSKYVQSEIGTTFKKVKEDIKKGKLVLFSGTPCQIQGLKNFIGNIDMTNLILCDIICHGVPSTYILKKYIKELEKRYKSKIVKIDFRKKDKNFGIKNMFIIFESGKEVFIPSYYDNFYHLFERELIARECCSNCKFANLNRTGDISIGDFWGIEKFNKDFNDNKGVSLVIVNSNKGKEIFDSIKDNFNIIESNSENSKQPSLEKPTSKNKYYYDFWNDVNKYDLDYLDIKYSDRSNIKKVIGQYLCKFGINHKIDKIKKKEIVKS